MTSVDYIVLSISLILAVIAICSLPWLCQWLVRSLRHSMRNSTGGSAYNPLQEMIQPQIRHVVEVQQQRLTEDGSGGPPDDGCESLRPRQ
jgi:hypothetical protein